MKGVREGRFLKKTLFSLPLMLVAKFKLQKNVKHHDLWQQPKCPIFPTVERLYCKRPIQCLASSKILTPPTPTLPGECVPLVWGEDTLARGREGWGVNILEDAKHSSVLDICKYLVFPTPFDSHKSHPFKFEQKMFLFGHLCHKTVVYKNATKL
jgi:hypothetical protein